MIPPDEIEVYEEDAVQLVNELAPVTRRDEWWGSAACLATISEWLFRRDCLVDAKLAAIIERDYEDKGPQ
jgi:hypothetical protein